ncbi:MAG: CgeB family protein [Nitrospirota bacterium]
MRVILFYHSLLSDWNHGNAHFLRGIVAELLSRGHEVAVYEPRDAWSLRNLLAAHGLEPLRGLRTVYPWIKSTRYDLKALDLDRVLQGGDLVIVHEWNEHELIRRIGEYRARVGGFRLFFHDTHHRSVTDPKSMAVYDLSHYDGVLAFGEVIRTLYIEKGWAERAWTWHEAADTRVFRPIRQRRREGDLVWIGNWGDDERTSELQEFLIEPVKALGLKAQMHGVRYPHSALKTIEEAGIHYSGWLPNYAVPDVFARFSITIHIPRRPYVKALPGIPTIRPFEALACGIPLVCAPWNDDEGLFTPGKDFLVARNGREMKRCLKALLQDREMARALSEHGLKTIRERHTCAHRIDELLSIYKELEGEHKSTPQRTNRRINTKS